eukprot:39970-Eustigmatos_ZCMA.PRE.1
MLPDFLVLPARWKTSRGQQACIIPPSENSSMPYMRLTHDATTRLPVTVKRRRSSPGALAM